MKAGSTNNSPTAAALLATVNGASPANGPNGSAASPPNGSPAPQASTGQPNTTIGHYIIGKPSNRILIMYRRQGIRKRNFWISKAGDTHPNWGEGIEVT